MKKILLGLTILSAMAYATTTGVTTIVPSTNTVEEEANQISGVQITTRANVLSSGIVITSATDGTGVMGNLELNHSDLTSTILADETTPTNASGTFYIKRANNNERLGRAGYKLRVSLNHDGILKHETILTDTSATLNHTLNLIFPAKSQLNISSNKETTTENRTKMLELTNSDYVIAGSVNSVIAAAQNNALAGNYVNDALMTVTISKE